MSNQIKLLEGFIDVTCHDIINNLSSMFPLKGLTKHPLLRQAVKSGEGRGSGTWRNLDSECQILQQNFINKPDIDIPEPSATTMHHLKEIYVLSTAYIQFSV